MSDAASMAQVLASLHQTLAGVVEDLVAIDAGYVARTRSLPHLWTLNQVNVTGDVGVDELVALGEEHQVDLAFRHVVVDDEAVGRALQAPLAAMGWEVGREVLMVLGPEAPVPLVGAAPIVELAEDEMVRLMRRWLVEEDRGDSNDVLDQVAEYNVREGRLWDEIRLGVRDPAGEPVALTKLRRRDGVAWVEDVYTVPAARRRGYARALVTRAVELAREASPALTFIIADDDDWPKHLYASIGFAPVGVTRTFHLDLRGRA
jgi:GNAT superfamily N-acetyltransferase